MRNLRGRSVGLRSVAAGAVVLAAARAFAEQPADTAARNVPPCPTVLSEKIDQLEAAATSQQARIDRLAERVSAATDRSTGADRVAGIRAIVREALADAEFRDGLYPDLQRVGYDKGFYIAAADETFLLKINGWSRIRWTGQNRQTDNPRQQGRQKQDDINGFEVEDLRLNFSGHIHSPKLTYRIQVSGDTDQAHTWRTWDAYVTYAMAKEAQLTVGLAKVPFGRQRSYTKSTLHFIDRSIGDETFNLNRSIGAYLRGMLVDRLSYAIGISNGLANRDDTLEELDTNFAYSARLVAHILGDPIKTEGDLAYSKDPRFEIGLSAAYNDDNGDRGRSTPYSVPDRIRSGRGIGGYGTADLTGTDLLQFGADTAFQYRGLSLSAEYWLRSVDGDSEFSQWERLTGRDDARHYQAGYLQAGYFVIPKRLEAVARLGGLWDADGDDTWEVTCGLNYFPWGTYNLVLQVDVTRIGEAPYTSSSGNWAQNDEVTMVRLQIQAQF
ncbi:MAG: hypothetical protein JXQ73_05425 [Phycisphaerae bacterium]|nr:hypothetical protein [Phycisphaerae bacterium]